MNDKGRLGNVGEKLAASYLRKLGYKIIGKNFRCRLGEVDLIALEGDSLVFVEVKTRWSKSFGLPEEAVTFRKLKAIAKVGEYYRIVNEEKELPESSRIDVVAIETDISGLPVRQELIKNAGS